MYRLSSVSALIHPPMHTALSSGSIKSWCAPAVSLRFASGSGVPQNDTEKAMAYEAHVRLRTANNLYQCRSGSRALQNDTEKAMAYEAHVRLRTANNLYQCRYGCLPAYRYLAYLNQHMVRNHNWETVYPKQKPGQKVPSCVLEWEPEWEAWSSKLQASKVSPRRTRKRKCKYATISLANMPMRREKQNLQQPFWLDPSLHREDGKVMAEELATNILKEKKEQVQQLRAQPLICRIFPPTRVPGMTCSFSKEYLSHMQEKLGPGPIFTWQEFKDGLEAVCKEEADAGEKVKKEVTNLAFLFLRNDIKKDFNFLLEQILSDIALFVEEWQDHQAFKARTAICRELLEQRRANFVKGCLLQYDALQGLTYGEASSASITATTALSPLVSTWSNLVQGSRSRI